MEHIHYPNQHVPAPGGLRERLPGGGARAGEEYPPAVHDAQEGPEVPGGEDNPKGILPGSARASPAGHGDPNAMRFTSSIFTPRSPSGFHSSVPSCT